MYLTYRYRIKGRSAAKKLDQMAFACNQVWNYCGGIQNDSYRHNKPWPTFAELCRLTSGAAAELGVHSNTVSMVVRSWCQSRYKHHKRPRWRISSGSNRSLGWVPFGRWQCLRIQGDTIIYRNIPFKVWLSRPIPRTIKAGSFSQDSAGNWFINLICEVDAVNNCGDAHVGIDLGLDNLAVLSNGEKIENPRYLKRSSGQLAKAQRLGRKAVARKIHRKVAAQRRHYLHVLSKRIVKENSLIVVGDINSKKLMRSAMSKSVADTAWSELRSQLRYKAIGHGATYVEVDERWTTRTCSDCGSRDGSPEGLKGLRVRVWTCLSCGSVHDRDVNAALNILHLGRSVALQKTKSGESRVH